MKVFNFATKHTLFPVLGWGMTQEEIDEEHIGYINKILNSGDPVDKSFTEYVAKKLPTFGTLEIQHLSSFLLMTLQIDQKKRAPTSKLLGHPFLAQDTPGK